MASIRDERTGAWLAPALWVASGTSEGSRKVDQSIRLTRERRVGVCWLAISGLCPSNASMTKARLNGVPSQQGAECAFIWMPCRASVVTTGASGSGLAM